MGPKEIILAALSAANGASHTPVQVQKMFFLIDENIADDIGGKKFDFQPYSYGPFDKQVYDELVNLASAGLINIAQSSDTKYNIYTLTPTGQSEGEKILTSMPEQAVEYIKNVSGFVRRLSFKQLVSAIYEHYPEMKKNSVFVS